MNAYLHISSQYMKAVKLFRKRAETRLLNLSEKVLTIISTKK